MISNLYLENIDWEGITYKCVHDAWVASAYLSTDDRILIKNGGAPKGPVRSDWGTCKDEIMYLLLLKKFGMPHYIPLLPTIDLEELNPILLKVLTKLINNAT